MPYVCAYSIVNVCVQHHILAHTFLPAAQLYFCWRDFFFSRDFYFAGATFFLLARLFFAGTTFFFLLARIVFLVLICRPLLVLLRAQSTSTCCRKQDG